MIYLIGGAPKCGKTTLAKKLSLKFKIPWVSADTLSVVGREYMEKNEADKKFPWSKIRKIKQDNDSAYKAYNAKEIVKFYITQAKATYKAIDMFSLCEIKDENNYIIEGYQIEPQLVNKLYKKYGAKNFKTVFLARTDVVKTIKNIKKSTTPNDWILKRTKKEETYNKIAEMIVEYSNFFEKESKKYGFKIFNMDENFNKQLNIIQSYIK
jgi:2-phosphoglycerate kinase